MHESPTILIDATAIPLKLGGVGRYLEGLSAGLSRFGCNFAIVVRPEHEKYFATVAPTAKILTAPPAINHRGMRFVWEQFALPRIMRRVGAPVLHSPHYTFPLLIRGGRVVTLHDATFLSDPQAHSRLKRLFFSWWIRRALRRDITVVVPSRATESELRRFVRGIRATIVVAHHGVDTALFAPPSQKQIENLRAILGLPQGAPWLAFLGTIEPRKNVPALIRAHQQLRRDRGAALPDLFIAGARGWDEDASQLLDGLPSDASVHEVGYLPLEQLGAFLGGATLVAYPSSAEGFGLPVLEAMAAGACVLTTRRLAIPEVGGDAVAYSEPDEEGIAAALGSLLDDASERKRLAVAARERAGIFTWEAAARTHAEAYRHAAESLRRAS